ncbi:MAG: 5-(carboxyamino)imidazole ribonucleotide mutase [Pseudomonadota bacterium]
MAEPPIADPSAPGGGDSTAGQAHGQVHGPARVGIVMGSQSDWPTMKAAAGLLDTLGIAHEVRIVSAHRTPDRLFAYAEGAAARGLAAIIAGAGGAAHLPGMLAAKTRVPVLGVPVRSRALSGLDSLLSIVQMPRGIPVATFAIGEAGAANAALFAAAQIATADPAIATRLEAWRAAQSEAVALEPVDLPAEDAAGGAPAQGHAGTGRAG